MGTPIIRTQETQFGGLLVQKKLELDVVYGNFVQICVSCVTRWISRREDFGKSYG